MSTWSQRLDEWAETGQRLDRARRLVDQHPARAAALLYQVVSMLEVVLERRASVAASRADAD